MTRAFVSGDLNFTVEGDTERAVEGEDSAIAGLPSSCVVDGMVDVVGAYAIAHAAAMVCCDMAGRMLHHAEVVVSKDVDSINGVTDWTHCDECMKGLARATQALQENPELVVIGMRIYFARRAS